MRLSLEGATLTARAARLPVVALGPVAAVGLVVLISLHDDATAPAALVVAALVSAAGFGTVLDDAAADVLAPSPTTFAHRRLRRIGLGATVLAAGWLAVLLTVELTLSPPPIPAGAATLEAAALASVVLALSAAGRRISGAPGGTAAALGLLPLTGFVGIVGHVSPSWPLPSLVPGANAARWWWVIAACLAVIVWLSRDPGSPALLASGARASEMAGGPAGR